MSKAKPLELENLKITVKDVTGQKYAFSEKRMLESLEKNGMLSLLEYTDRIELDVGSLRIVVERK